MPLNKLTRYQINELVKVTTKERAVMKISYMLLNQNGVDSEIPKGLAWKWILHIEDKIEIYLIVENLKKKIADNKLTLVNLEIDQLCSSDDFLNLACKSFKDPVVYDEFIPVARTISTHVENDSSKFRYDQAKTTF